MSNDKHDKSTTDGLLAAWRAAAHQAIKERSAEEKRPTSDPLVLKWRASAPTPVTIKEKARTLEEKLEALKELDPRTHDLVLKALDAEPDEKPKQAEDDEAW